MTWRKLLSIWREQIEKHEKRCLINSFLYHFNKINSIYITKLNHLQGIVSSQAARIDAVLPSSRVNFPEFHPNLLNLLWIIIQYSNAAAKLQEPRLNHKQIQYVTAKSEGICGINHCLPRRNEIIFLAFSIELLPFSVHKVADFRLSKFGNWQWPSRDHAVSTISS